MRLFLSQDGKSGFALKNGDDIVSVFSDSKTGTGDSIVECAIAAGGRRLDCFNTVLPAFYGAHGFVPVARIAWNDEYAPPDWDYKTYEGYNGGRPDICFMVYAGKNAPIGLKEGKIPRVQSYEEGEALQQEEIEEQRELHKDANKGIQYALAPVSDNALIEGPSAVLEIMQNATTLDFVDAIGRWGYQMAHDLADMNPEGNLAQDMKVLDK